MRYIALLRGINVGGNTVLKMDDLRRTFEALGFRNVVTYINSGNLAFDSRSTPEEKLVARIEKALEKDLARSINVMIRTRSAVADVLAQNPFEGQFETHKQMHVLFTRSAIPAKRVNEILALQTERELVAVFGREIYALLFDGVAESQIGRGLIERKLKIPITARNWRTVEKLVDL